ncbi:MAG: hypothetical protein FJZ95_07900 [Chloroflexi bacterium]|nr:hypothetical protein [Chloroflexota bacterium]
MFIVGLLVQLVILIVAMVVAGLILRWIMANPEKCKAGLRRVKRWLITPLVMAKAFWAYLNWKRVKMGLSYRECLAREWHKREPDRPYYRL